MEYYKNTGIALAVMLLTSGTVNAAVVASNQVMPTGTLNVTGTILDTACVIETPDVVIQFPAQQLDAFTTASSYSPTVNVPFNLSHCPKNATVTMTMAGTQGASAAYYLPDAAVTTTTGLQFRMLFNNATWQVNSTKTLIPDANGDVSAQLGAQVFQTGANPTAGTMGATLTYTLAYN